MVLFEEKKRGLWIYNEYRPFHQAYDRVRRWNILDTTSSLFLTEFLQKSSEGKVLFATLVFAVKAFTGQDEESIGIDLNTCLFTF